MRFLIPWLKWHSDMRPIYYLKRLIDLWDVQRIGAEFSERMAWDVDTLRGHQEERLHSLVVHARKRSRFYRELYSHLPLHYQLADLPVINKKVVLDHFDDLVVDQRLSLSALQQHLAGLVRDDYFLGRYRAFSSSGTTGRIGYFVFDRREWNTVQANRRRTGSLGQRGSSTGKGKIALLLTNQLQQVSVRSALTMGLVTRGCRIIDYTINRSELVLQLNRMQPDQLVGYASTVAVLAQEQLAGRLNIHPREIVTGAEMLAETMIQQIQEAWSMLPKQTYGMTESPSLGFPCPVHPMEIHLCEDLTLIENVDSHNRPVPDGVVGDKILLTNLYNKTQPLIRYEISDRLLLAPGPCECGVPFRRLRRCFGRTDDLLVVPGRLVDSVSVEPILLETAICRVADVLQYQIVQNANGLKIRLIVDCEEERKSIIAGDVRASLQRMFESRLAKMPAIIIEFVDEIDREPGGKLRLIKSESGGGSGEAAWASSST